MNTILKVGNNKRNEEEEEKEEEKEEEEDCSATNKNKAKVCLKKLSATTLQTLDFSEYKVWTNLADLLDITISQRAIYNKIVKWDISVKYSWGTKISTKDIANEVDTKYTDITVDMAMCRMENLATDDLEKAFKDVTKYVNDFWDYGCVFIENPWQKVGDKIEHIMSAKFQNNNTTWEREYTWLHSLNELDESEYVIKILSSTLNPSNTSYEAIILVKKDWESIVKWNNGWKSSVFPDSWNRQRIIEEVTYAVTYNNGRDLTWSDNEYKWLSKNNVQLNFYLSSQWTTIPSYFPKIY